MKITNKSLGHRGVNVRGNNDVHVAMSIAPGETLDADLYDAHNPVYKGWEQAGDLDFGGDLTAAASESLARVKAEAEAAAKPRRGRPKADPDAPDADAS